MRVYVLYCEYGEYSGHTFQVESVAFTETEARTWANRLQAEEDAKFKKELQKDDLLDPVVDKKRYSYKVVNSVDELQLLGGR